MFCVTVQQKRRATSASSIRIQMDIGFVMREINYIHLLYAPGAIVLQKRQQPLERIATVGYHLRRLRLVNSFASCLPHLHRLVGSDRAPTVSILNADKCRLGLMVICWYLLVGCRATNRFAYLKTLSLSSSASSIESLSFTFYLKYQSRSDLKKRVKMRVFYYLY